MKMEDDEFVVQVELIDHVEKSLNLTKIVHSIAMNDDSKIKID